MAADPRQRWVRTRGRRTVLLALVRRIHGAVDIAVVSQLIVHMRGWLNQPISVGGSLVQKVEGIVRSVDASAHHRLSVRVLHLLVIIAVVRRKVAARPRSLTHHPRRVIARSAQGLVPPVGASRRERRLAVESTVNLRGRLFVRQGPLPSIAHYVLIHVATLAIVRLPLPPGSAEEALLTLTPAAHAGRIVGVVDAAKVTSYLAATARDACLIDALMLCVGSGSGSGGGALFGLMVLLVRLGLGPGVLANGRARGCTRAAVMRHVQGVRE